MRRTSLAIVVVALLAAFAGAGASAAQLKVTWMHGAHAPATPARYDKVGVLRVGPRSARNVLVLEPGTSAGSAYFAPLARWIVSRDSGWQVWAVERRENLLEDQSVLDEAKRGTASATKLYDYYQGYLNDPSITSHIQPIPDATVAFAKRWGMAVAVGDLHRVIERARSLGGRVVLGGHSLGGAVVTAYASWNFAGKPGADQLSGLVYIDGGSLGTAESAPAARAALTELDATGTSPWDAFGGIPAPDAGLFSMVGSLTALIAPRSPSLGQSSGLLATFGLTPAVAVDNLAQFGYALNVGTSPSALIAAQAHLGAGITASGALRGWNGAGALTPIRRYATMMAGAGVTNADGSEWYFPARLTLDVSGVGNGTASPAQRVLGLRSTLGRRLPLSLRIYGFGARLGGAGILAEIRQLARQSGIASSHLTLIDRQASYAHNDPAGAYPRNVFFSHLVTFLHTVAR
jgi:pimeloyl-ACP methyl ester carboxylesterase